MELFENGFFVCLFFFHDDHVINCNVCFNGMHTQAATLSAFWGRKIFDAFSAVKSLFSKFSDAGGQGF